MLPRKRNYSAFTPGCLATAACLQLNTTRALSPDFDAADRSSLAPKNRSSGQCR
jgi:hypothetical protein